jgi:plastocyanin
MRLKGLYFSVMLSLFLGVFASLGHFAALNPVLAKPDAHAGGSVAGRVTIDGQLPQPSRISMSADPSCATTHRGPTVNEELVTGSGGTLGNVIVFVSEGLGNRSFDVPAEPVEVDQKGCMYLPRVVGVQAQQKLRFVNSDNTSHNIHPVPTNNREWNKAQPAGTTFEETFAREEIAIPVKCNVHSWMRSYIAVFKHPFFAVTGVDGHFDLRNLPPGEYTVEAWHEKFGAMKQAITVAPGEAKNMEFVFKARAH